MVILVLLALDPSMDFGSDTYSFGAGIMIMLIPGIELVFLAGSTVGSLAAMAILKRRGKNTFKETWWMLNINRVRRFIALPLLILGGCGPSSSEALILEAVQQASGNNPELQLTRVSWCADTVDGKRAAFVAAVGPVQSAAEGGSGGYLVEVADDGTIASTVKATGMSPSSEALRIDRKYCSGELVAKPQEAINRLREMQSGGY